MAEDLLALTLGYVRRARLASQAGGGRLARAYLLEKARDALEEARTVLTPQDYATRKLFDDIEAELAKAEADLARE
jgi:hypothetical protein